MERTSVLAAAAFLALLALVGASWAQEDARAPCTWETAQPLTVRGLDSSETAFRGRCVRLRADLDGWKLSTTRRVKGVFETEIDFIGAYSNDETMLPAFRDRPRRVEVLGVVGHCSDVCADAVSIDAEGNTVLCMATGFCHYHSDPYVMIEAVR